MIKEIFMSYLQGIALFIAFYYSYLLLFATIDAIVIVQ